MFHRTYVQNKTIPHTTLEIMHYLLAKSSKMFSLKIQFSKRLPTDHILKHLLINHKNKWIQYCECIFNKSNTEVISLFKLFLCISVTIINSEYNITQWYTTIKDVCSIHLQERTYTFISSYVPDGRVCCWLKWSDQLWSQMNSTTRCSINSGSQQRTLADVTTSSSKTFKTCSSATYDQRYVRR